MTPCAEKVADIESVVPRTSALPATLAEGATVYGDVRGKRLPATVVPMPFLPNRFKR